MNAEPISFVLLNDKISEYIKETETPNGRPGCIERWALVAGCAAGGQGLILAKLLSGTLAVQLVNAALILELVGLATSLVCMVQRGWHNFRRPHAEFSRELDQTFDHYVKLVASLRRCVAASLRRCVAASLLKGGAAASAQIPEG